MQEHDKFGDKPLLLIDTSCTLCNRTLKYIMKHGGKNKLEHISLFSDQGSEILRNYGLSENYDKSVVLIENNQVYLKSEAALRVSKKLNGVFPLLYWLRFIPLIIRDMIYDFIARNRYRI